MKVRVKYSNTQKFVVTLEDPNLGNLKEEIRKFVENTYGETVKEPLTLSLNGTDALTGSADIPLQSLGIVPGDLIKVIPPSSPAACPAVPQRVLSSPKRQATMQPCTSASASDSRPIRMEGPSGGASGDGPSSTSSAKSEQPDRKAEETPVSLLIEAKDGCPPPSLVDLFSKCSPTSPSQAVNLMVHLTMLECGFCLEGSTEPPPGWKEMVATIHYSHNTLPEFKCTLVLVTMGEVKQVMASFQQQESEISVKLLVGEYVKKGNDSTVTTENLIRVAQLARTLRNQLLHPLQVAAHEILGVPAPWHLAGLPQELLLMIAKNLDAKSVLSLGQSCKRLHSVTEDNKLWQSLYKRDFTNLYESMAGLNDMDWKAKYREAVTRRKEWRNLQDNPDMKFETPEFYPSPFGPTYPSYPSYPGMPPRNPDPYPPQPPQPHPMPNPFYDPDSPFFMGEIPPVPGVFPNVPNPLNPMLPRGPRPNNPFVPPFMPTRHRTPRGPRFDFFSSDFM
ncbi:F-box only protein 7-like [Penaeus monodon]|uniref:F-box only protein 7-like n=1 Tax=Penaeus monodon TaxID=6687 RepID=UPI0018A78002|nr:F-box only protein 7-like [Penaeus monodon]